MRQFDKCLGFSRAALSPFQGPLMLVTCLLIGLVCVYALWNVIPMLWIKFFAKIKGFIYDCVTYFFPESKSCKLQFWLVSINNIQTNWRQIYFYNFQAEHKCLVCPDFRSGILDSCYYLPKVVCFIMTNLKFLFMLSNNLFHRQWHWL